MGFRIGRKRSERLRIVAQGFGFLGPVRLLVLAQMLGDVAGIALLILAAIMQLVGLLVERWLFVAEAAHTISLYYRLPS
ncbi:MAG: hypothetical protein ACP5QR_09135 [Rhizomicrobium sp.]